MIVRINLQEKRTLLGNKLNEEITLKGNTLWGRNVLLMILMITLLGIPLISSVGDFNDEFCWGWITIAGDIEPVEDRSPVEGKERTLLGIIFPLQLAEDNPVRLL